MSAGLRISVIAFVILLFPLASVNADGVPEQKTTQHFTALVRGRVQVGQSGTVSILVNPKSRSRVVFVVEGGTFGLEKMDGQEITVKGEVNGTGSPYRKKLRILSVPNRNTKGEETGNRKSR